MADNKKQHYVPRFYLKKFSINGRSLCLWNMTSNKKVTSANLKNQCYKDYYYGKDLTVEKALGLIERKAACILKVIEKNKLPPAFGSGEHVTLLLYISLQHSRTPYIVDAMDEIVNNFTKHLLKEKAKAENLDLSGITINLKEGAQHSLSMVAQSYYLLLDLNFKLLINKTTTEFITSDTPVVLYNQLLSFRKQLCNTGLQSKGLQFFFPISPSLLLIFFDPSSYSLGNKSSSFISVNLERDVHELNTLQASSAYKNIYFRSPTFNIEPLLKKASPFRRKHKTKMDIIPNYEKNETKSEFIASSREDINTGLNLSFLRLTKRTKAWLKPFKKQREQPLIVVRNEEISNDYSEFKKKVRDGIMKPSEFLKFLFDKYDI